MATPSKRSVLHDAAVAMTPAARVSAGIEVLADIEGRRRPAADALKDWGLAHRFAGSGDRAAIASLVHDTLRRRASAAYVMGSTQPRALLLGMLRLVRGVDTAAAAALFSGDRFAPEPLSADERHALEAGSLDRAPAHVLGDHPEWLSGSLRAGLGEAATAEAAALAARAPVDLRVNALKIARPAALQALGHFGVMTTPHAPTGLRIAERPDGRAPAIQSDPAFLKGQIEIQDEGSQLVSLLAASGRPAQVLDLCAGGGGKTLALAAMMNNRGQIYATDNDMRRLAPIHARLERAGVRNVQVRTPKGRGLPDLGDLDARMDLVLVDAPCTGTGTWRRNPDAKWRLRPGSLEQRIAEQTSILATAWRFVRPGGRLAYVTCSMLDEENGGAVRALVSAEPDLKPLVPDVVASEAGLDTLARWQDPGGVGFLFTPLRTGTDGFFLAVLQRAR